MTYLPLPETPTPNSSSYSSVGSLNRASQSLTSSRSARKGRSPGVISHLLRSIRQRIDQVHIDNPVLARWLCRTIPTQCPFERDIILLGRTVAHIPPLCKLNPFYQEVISLRFRALCYLADECGEDVRPYC